MDKNKTKFWAGCPYCKKKFGIEPKFVMMYLKRVIDSRKHKIDALQDMLNDAQKEIDEGK